MKLSVAVMRIKIKWSLSARRVWIEIIYLSSTVISRLSHSLRGECGLKYSIGKEVPDSGRSLSARRVWIEIGSTISSVIASSMSLSARRVWIEIDDAYLMETFDRVTLCEESVD